jgi:hypothetical protein
VTGPGGVPITEGTVTLTDNGQTQTVSVSNGHATATFHFNLLQELKTVGRHSVGGSFSTTTGNFGSASTTFQAPGNLFGFVFQLALDAGLVNTLTGGKALRMMKNLVHQGDPMSRDGDDSSDDGEMSGKAHMGMNTSDDESDDED